MCISVILMMERGLLGSDKKNRRLGSCFFENKKIKVVKYDFKNLSGIRKKS